MNSGQCAWIFFDRNWFETDQESNFRNVRHGCFAISSKIAAKRFRETLCWSTFGDIDERL